MPLAQFNIARARFDLDDPRMADRVATITGRLVTEAIAMYPNTADWEWSVAIIDDDETVNAWCMAGQSAKH